MNPWQEVKWAVKEAAYFEYLPDYKPGLFPSHLDRKHGMRRYQAWVEYFLRGRKPFSSTEEFRVWLEGWEQEVKEMVEVCHSFGVKVIMCCSDGFNIGAHVYNEKWFDLPADFPTTKSPGNWVIEKDDPVGLDNHNYTKLPEGDLIAPYNASDDYVEYSRISAEQLIDGFGVDGLYYDNNAYLNRTLLRATAEVAHRKGRVLMLHHSMDNMTAHQFQTADYWYTGENSYGRPPGPKTNTPCDSEEERTAHDFLKRRQTMGAGFMYGISLTNCWWGGAPNTSNTNEEVGYGFLMCGLKFPMLYPGDPVAEKLWSRYLPLYRAMVKPGTVAYVCVTQSSFVKELPGQFKPLSENPGLLRRLRERSHLSAIHQRRPKEGSPGHLQQCFQEPRERRGRDQGTNSAKVSADAGQEVRMKTCELLFVFLTGDFARRLMQVQLPFLLRQLPQATLTSQRQHFLNGCKHFQGIHYDRTVRGRCNDPPAVRAEAGAVHRLILESGDPTTGAHFPHSRRLVATRDDDPLAVGTEAGVDEETMAA